MFPPSLHQNIRELDKQISLLENEYENMESGKRKKVVNGKAPNSKTSKASNSFLKSPPVKETSKKPFVTGPPRSVSAGSSRKLSAPPVMSKWSSASSVPYKEGCRRSCSGRVESPVTEVGLQKAKSNRSQTNLRNGEKEKINSNRDSCTCACSKQQRSVPPETSKEVLKYQKDDCVNHLLHKEVLYTNPGSTIEVTVTQKSNKSQNEGNGQPPKRSIGLIKEMSESNSEKSNGCSCAKGDGKEVNGRKKDDKNSSGQKWCDLLSDRDYGRNEKKKFFTSDLNGIKRNNDPLLPKLHCYYVKTNPETNCKDFEINETTRLKSPNSVPTKENNNDPSIFNDCKKCKEQEVQCLLWDIDPKKYDVPLDLYNPIRTLHFSLNQLKKKQGDEDTNILIAEMENAMQKICSERTKPTYNSCFQPNNRNKGDDMDNLTEKENNGYINYLQTNYNSAKKMCDKLTAEKEQISKELTEKDRRLANMINDEKKYLSLISSLKVNLEKSKGEAEDSVRLLKEINIIKNKLLDETKAADALRKSHAKMQERVQKCLLENDKLKTQIRMHKLEAQKFDLILAGKDVEIKRYKEEMESFQKQISEQLAVLRSNAAMNEVEKAMEAIIHHSQLFSQTDLESIRSESQIDRRPKSSSTKTREKLMHSSPTSTKASVLDSSWNQISSIYGDDHQDKDSVILTPLKSPKIRLSSNRNNGCQEVGAPKRSFDINPKPKNVSEQKKEPSFTSCKSVIDLEGSDRARDLKHSYSGVMNDDPTLCHDSEGNVTKKHVVLTPKESKKIKSNIEDLFNDWRLKLKEKISSARNNINFEDFFDDCPLSDLSQGSEDLSITLSEIESQTDVRN